MENFNLDDLWSLESSYEDERVRDPIAEFTQTFDPLTSLLPDPLLSGITTSLSPPPLSEPTDTVSSALTDEETAHIDNLIFFGVDAPVLPPDLLIPPVAAAETPPALDPVVPQLLPTQPTASSVSSLPATPTSTLFNPTTTYAAPSVSPPRPKRRFSIATGDEPNEPQESTPGPSDPRPSKRPRFSYPGESSFQLDTRVAPLELKPIKSAGRPIDKPPRAARTDYSACRCPGGLTSNPARHWRTCPYNPNAGEKRFRCELCGRQFTREDNKFRHMEDYHQ
ncbi:hypothetical protein FRC04_010221 [Tulasnella sp. 424]|nr:hypothetical protein FRC04_010221 [Tulasnella sp. 424]